MLLDALNALDPVGADGAEETAAPPLLSEPQRDALVRALMRREAALLRKDADRFPTLDRSVDERRSVALLLLAADVFTTARRLGLVSTTADPAAAATCGVRPDSERAVASSRDPGRSPRDDVDVCADVDETD